MSVQVLLVLTEIVLLFFFSRILVKNLYILFLLLFHARSVAVSLVTAILFPGTIIHELSHLFTAEILGVRTGKLTLVPESIRENDVQTGSVAIAQTDPFRRALIGLAPLTNGLLAVIGLSYFIVTWDYSIITIFLFYLLFCVTLTMFPSAPDIKGTPAVAITLGILLLAAYFLGIRIGLTGQILLLLTRLLDGLVKSLGFVTALNILGVLGIHGIIVLVQKLLQRKLVR